MCDVSYVYDMCWLVFTIDKINYNSPDIVDNSIHVYVLLHQLVVMVDVLILHLLVLQRHIYDTCHDLESLELSMFRISIVALLLVSEIWIS